MAPTFATRSDLQRVGQHLQETVPHQLHGEFSAVDRDPIAILEAQNATRLQDLVPLRWGRMLQSPFAYYRATAAIMASDLANQSTTGLHVVSCGDAHIANFGLYASPERRLVFDLNDFDEAGMGPWEWDLKRLVASVVIGGRSAGYTRDQISEAAVTTVASYRETTADLADMTALDRYFAHVDHHRLLDKARDKADRKVITRAVNKASKRTSEQSMSKLITTSPDGSLRFVEQPPISQHVDHGDEERLRGIFEQYRKTLRADTALLLDKFRLVDYVLRVVGVGSVGTRCYVLLFMGPSGEPLFLQAKEAGTSVLESHGGVSNILPDALPDPTGGNHGYRVVSCQRILQAQSDPFLGWVSGYAGEKTDQPPVSYYWRQFRDMKGSVDLERLAVPQFAGYGRVCALLLARAHSQSRQGLAIAAYLENDEEFDTAIADWAEKYADQIERDFAAVERAADEGRIAVERET